MLFAPDQLSIFIEKLKLRDLGIDMRHSKEKFKYLSLGATFFSLLKLGQSNVGARFNEFKPYVVDGIYFGEQEFCFLIIDALS